jgi:pimeloyl-ACP methyl ester carboxylesterase
MATPTPFRIAVPDDQLTWIQDRIRTARLPPARDLPPDQKWSFGLPRDVADQLQQHWVGGAYDWRRIEAGLNADLSMYTLPVTQAGADMTLHFVHHRSAEPDAIPLLFLHGWPGSFLEVQPVLGELVKPKMSSSSSSSSSSSPGDRAQAYHVVAPSLPGFGFSSYPSVPLDLGNMAAALNKLMLALGYDRYICQGGDWGSFLSRVIAHDHGDHCVGIHLNMVFATPPLPWKAPLACARVVFSYLTGWWGDYGAAMLKRMKWWWSDETGYFRIQGTKPLTLAYALVDSPFGQMCWIREKIENLVDDGFTWDNDTVITWAMVGQPASQHLPPFCLSSSY